MTIGALQHIHKYGCMTEENLNPTSEQLERKSLGAMYLPNQIHGIVYNDMHCNEIYKFQGSPLWWLPKAHNNWYKDILAKSRICIGMKHIMHSNIVKNFH